MADAIKTCRSCGAKVRWVRTLGGSWMPLDYESSPAGNVVLAGDGRARTLKKGQAPEGEAYTSHFATCPLAAKHRRAR